MSSSTTSSLSTGVQQLYNDGLLPSGLNSSTLNSASTAQLNKMASSTIALQQLDALLGTGSSSSTDSTSLSSTASNALLQEINPTSSSSSSSTTDPLTAAVDNALTSNINAAVNRFAPTSGTGNGSLINLLA